MTRFKIGLYVSAIVLLAGTATVFAKQDDKDSPPGFAHGKHARVCVDEPGTFRCHARVVVDDQGVAKAAVIPSGITPADFHAAYAAAVTASGSPIIAIVDAYDHPSILLDLNTYSAQFGIPGLPACSGPIASSPTACFKKVNQRGGNSTPSANAGWALEIALDVEAAHAMCQNCKILLVESDNSSMNNLAAAFDRAVILGAKIISNSYGASEFPGENAFDSHYNLPGSAITFSSGDSGYGVEYPAASSFVTAVGGTSLHLNPDKTYQSESAWSGAGSGCSAFESKPLWQNDSLCANRSVADVAAVADPATGAAVYDSVRYQGRKGWFVVGGTSLAAPLVAGVYALAGVPAGAMGNALPYGATASLHDIADGSNGSCGTYFCNAGLGYDGPTGLGTPNGLLAF